METNKFNQTPKHGGSIPYFLLVSRLILFFLFQALIATIFHSWETSEKYWLLTATLTNIVSMALLFYAIQARW